MKKLTRFMAGAILSALGLAAGSRAAETVLFQDDFETDSSALWNTIIDATANTEDATVDWAFDYTAVNVTINGVEQTIPPAPNSTGATSRGVRLSVNNVDDTDPDTSAINLYAEGQNFSGDYALRFDLWINYNGGAYGGSGSTEFAMFGLNHLGTEPNWAIGSTVLPTSDGIWYAASGEGGAARDYRNYEGDGLGAPLEYQVQEGGFLDRDGDGVAEQEVNSQTAIDYPLNLLFPSPPYETIGAAGKHWNEVELRQRDGVITLVMNGYVIAEKLAATAASAGTVMLGMMDIFSSVANPAADNFVIFDNVRVVSLEDPALPQVSLAVGSTPAFEPDFQGSFSLTRSGDTTNPLEVDLRVRGTATSGADYQAIPTTATIPAGETELIIPVIPINDQIGELVETVKVDIVAKPDTYEVFAPMTGTVEIEDDFDESVVGIEVLDDSAFEGIEVEDALFSVYRVGDANSDLFVDIQVSGSATSGTDYELSTASPLVIPFGATNIIVSVRALADGEADPDETVTVTIVDGTFYKPDEGNESATATIREAGPLLYADDFNTDTSGNYTIQFGAANSIEDYRAGFAVDYGAFEGLLIPSSPRAEDNSTSGLVVTVNKDEESATGAAAVNVYTDEAFSGDYLVKFDMFLNYGATATTEAAIYGINHSGLLTNRYNTAGSDGVWFFVETDGSSQGGRAYVLFQPVDTNAVPPFISRRADEPYFTSIFTSPPFLAPGSPAGDWVDVSILQENDIITWRINNRLVFQTTNTTSMDSGKVMLGHADTFNSVGSTNTFTIYDNLRVYQIGDGTPEPSEIVISSIAEADGNIVITATTTGNLENLQLVGSETVDGTYTEVTNATITVIDANTAQATVPITGDQRFFQVLETP